jgi:hypothetical protein
MYTRRKFVKTLTAGAVITVAGSRLLASGFEGKRKLKKIGYIEGIIDKELKADWKAALRQTVKYGYSEIEIGRFMGESAKTFLKDCSEIGIKPVAGGAEFSKDLDEVNKSLDKLNELDLICLHLLAMAGRRTF